MCRLPFPFRIVGLFTPRGDGNQISMVQKSSPLNRWTLHPERGRKLSDRLIVPLRLQQIVGLFTPRGDGNIHENIGLEVIHKSLDSSPREGTETTLGIITKLPIHQSLDSSPREGTETFRATHIVIVLARFNRWTLHPERGRKRVSHLPVGRVFL